MMFTIVSQVESINDHTQALGNLDVEITRLKNHNESLNERVSKNEFETTKLHEAFRSLENLVFAQISQLLSFLTPSSLSYVGEILNICRSCVVNNYVWILTLIDTVFCPSTYFYISLTFNGGVISLIIDSYDPQPIQVVVDLLSPHQSRVIQAASASFKGATLRFNPYLPIHAWSHSCDPITSTCWESRPVRDNSLLHAATNNLLII
jgi:hypothetical protein